MFNTKLIIYSVRTLYMERGSSSDIIPAHISAVHYRVRLVATLKLKATQTHISSNIPLL